VIAASVSIIGSERRNPPAQHGGPEHQKDVAND